MKNYCLFGPDMYNVGVCTKHLPCIKKNLELK